MTQLTPDIIRKLDTISLAIFDVDGTLSRHDGSISEATTKALGRLSQAGYTIVIASGRTAPHVAGIFERIGTDGYAIGSNGANTIRTSDMTEVDANPIPCDTFHELLEYARTEGIEMTVFGHTGMYSAEPGPGHDLLTQINDEEPTIIDLAELADGGALKIMLYAEEEDMPGVKKRVLERFPQAVQTLPNFLEVNAAEVTKWTAIAPLLEQLGVDPAHVLGIGDSENDLAWLPNVGLPMAVANAYDHVKDLCELVIGDAEDDGVAEFIHSWLDARDSST